MKKVHLAIFSIIFSILIIASTVYYSTSIIRGAEEIIDNAVNIVEEEKKDEWIKVYLETWIPNKTANHKNTCLRVMNNYTVIVYNITITLGHKTWEYWDTNYELYELEPNEYIWFYYIVSDEQRIAYAYGWIKNVH